MKVLFFLVGILMAVPPYGRLLRPYGLAIQAIGISVQVTGLVFMVPLAIRILKEIL